MRLEERYKPTLVIEQLTAEDVQENNQNKERYGAGMVPKKKSKNKIRGSLPRKNQLDKKILAYSSNSYGHDQIPDDRVFHSCVALLDQGHFG